MQRLLGITIVVAIFMGLSAIFIHYTKPISLEVQPSEIQPTVDFEIDDKLDSHINQGNGNPIFENSSDFNGSSLSKSQGEMPAGWSVQLGSFMQVQNAMRLLKKLEEAGFKASTRQVVIKENSMTQVIVGPVSSYEEAQALKKHLATAVQLEGRVITASLD
jgi:hypothetical protein